MIRYYGSAHCTYVGFVSEFKAVSIFGFCKFLLLLLLSFYSDFRSIRVSLGYFSYVYFFGFLFLVGYHIVVVSQLFYSHPYKYLGSALAGLVCLGIAAAAGIIEAMTSQPANVDVFVCSGNG